MAVAMKRGDTEMMVSSNNFRVKEVSKTDRVLRFIGSDETPDPPGLLKPMPSPIIDKPTFMAV